ncbi:MAG: class I SAM-dependent methyltransferase [Chloroflexota bacterium]
MNLADFRALLTPAGQDALHAAAQLAPREENFLRDFSILQRRFPVDLARAALAVAILRGEAARKFAHPEELYFTREALEQASPEEVSAYRSQRYAPFERVADLGCSVGCDTLALARHVPVIGLDLDPLRLAMAAANGRREGHAVAFVQADLARPIPFPAYERTALFFDPARRAGHRRAFSVRDYSPPLSVIQNWLPNFPAAGVKISPGVDLDELAAYDCEIEFVSLRGELKEAALWFGPLRTAPRRATLLPGPHTLTPQEPGFAQTGTCPGRLPAIREPQACIYEPDPAILRAGLVRELAATLDAAQLDPDIAYLTAGKQTPTPFARAWAVEAWFPFQLKRLRAYLRERGVGRVTVKKRGSPLTPEALIRDLRLSGDEQRTVFLTHLRGEPIVVVAQ